MSRAGVVCEWRGLAVRSARQWSALGVTAGEKMGLAARRTAAGASPVCRAAHRPAVRCVDREIGECISGFAALADILRLRATLMALFSLRVDLLAAWSVSVKTERVTRLKPLRVMEARRGSICTQQYVWRQLLDR
jgi:hypothetical protein